MQAPAALTFSSFDAHSESILRNTTFLRNAALGNVTILAASPLTWDCPLGSCMPNVGQLFGDLLGCDRLCVEGHYGNASNHVTSACSGPCWTGHFCPVGSVLPQKCPAGSRMPNKRAATESDCILCAPGEHQPDSGQEECLPCQAGTFTAARGAILCTDCPPGGYCAVGAAAALPCISGTYSNSINLAAAGECTACPAGSACPTGSIDPTPCSPGFFAAKEGQAKCEPCPPGTSSGQGSVACDACEAGRYAANAGQGLCVPCPHPLSSVNGSTICSFCEDDYYLRDTSADSDDIFTSPTEYCKPCPTNAVCPDNTILSTLVLPRGFWRASPSSAVLTECRLFGGDAEAGEARCAGNERGAKPASRLLEEAGSDEYCASGFKGPECQLCAAENHYLVNGDECKKCAPRGTAAALIVGLVLGLCVACGLAAYIYSMASWRKKPCIGGPLRLADRASALYAKLCPTPKMKIMFAFYQVVLALSSTYSAGMPAEWTTWADPLATVIAIDWTRSILPEQCLGYGMRLLAVALSPVALIALLMGMGIALRLHHWRAAPPPRPKLWAEAALGLLDLTPAGLVLIFCFVPSITASVFRAWSCQAPPADDCRCSQPHTSALAMCC